MLGLAFHLIVQSNLFLLEIGSELSDPADCVVRIPSPPAALINDVTKRGHGFVNVIVPQETVIPNGVSKFMLGSLQSRVQLIGRFGSAFLQAFKQYVRRRG
jgi:hypothetical protein